MAKWREKNLGVQPVDAAEYTVEYDEFVKAVQKAGSVKVEGKILVNPTEDDLLSVRCVCVWFGRMCVYVHTCVRVCVRVREGVCVCAIRM